MKQKKSLQHRYHLTLAIMRELLSMELVNNSYQKSDIHNWRKDIDRHLKFDSTFFNNLWSSIPSDNQQKIYKSANKFNEKLIVFNKKACSIQSIKKSILRILRLEISPNNSTLTQILTYCYLVHLYRNSFHSALVDDRVFLSREYKDILDRVISYKEYLDANNAEQLKSYPSFLDIRNFKLNTPRYNVEEVGECIQSSIEYLKKQNNHVLSSDQELILNWKKNRLNSILQSMTDRRDESFNMYQHYISSEAFIIEYELLKTSILDKGTNSIFFSDSSYIDSGCEATWSLHSEKRNILQLTRRYKNRFPGLKFTRILLIDNREYTKLELANLSADISSLINHGVEVVLGDLAIAKQIDPYFNYAILDSGLSMRASKHHMEWKICKSKKNNQIHQEHYKTMLQDAKIADIKIVPESKEIDTQAIFQRLQEVLGLT